MKKQRYYFIDAARGFALLHMLFYHFCYDYFIIYGANPDWMESRSVFYWERFICISFILISGISAGFSRNLLKRGLMLNILGFIITLVSWLFVPDSVIFFGVLNLLGCSMLLMLLVRPLITEKNWLFAGIVSFLFFLITSSVPDGYLGIGKFIILKVPEFLYQIKIMSVLGMPSADFFSADYFPIFPWFFLFLTGYALQFSTERISEVKKMLGIKIPFLTYLGQKSLIIYMVHQPVLMLICMLMFA